MTKKPSLYETNPDIAEQWHPTLNGKLSPKDVTKGSNKRVWWKCDKGDDHEWEAVIALRTGKGYGCTICSGYKVALSTCLATKDPDLAEEWHPTLNGNLTPYDLIAASRKKVWWKCDKGEDHEWEATLGNRYLNKTGCPICNGNKVVKSNCISTTHPEIASQIDLQKNKDLDISKISIGYTKKIWWKCNKGDDHIWYLAPTHRKQNDGHISDCPYCAGVKALITNSLASLSPKITKEWHTTKNGNLTPRDVTNGSKKKVWWKCPKGKEHEWQATIRSRTILSSSCPYCSGRKASLTNNLKAKFPEIAKEWHPTKNGDKKPVDYTFGSQKKVWWKCDKGYDHEWEASIGGRTGTNKSGCPICHGLVVVKSNCLKALNPKLASEWHPTKNGKLTAYDVTLNSNERVWWKCDKGQDHEWIQTVSNRYGNNSSCPVCDGKKVVKSNCLTTTHPELIKEWSFERNKISPEKINFGAHVNVWWKCKINPTHEWKTSPRSKKGCPYCDLTPQSRQELVITFELMKLFKNINPKGYKTKLDGRLRAIDIFIPDLNLAIEFDGNYWHKDKRAIDKIKSEMLLEKGYKVIRMREEPLRKIHSNDVVSKLPYDGKKVTNDILTMITYMYELQKRKLDQINRYLSKDKLQNENALNRYIDSILEEKAKRET